MSDIIEIMRALAEQLHDELDAEFPGIQIEAPMVLNPSPDPVAIDIWHGDQDPAVGAFGYGNTDYIVNVRARINAADNEASQLELYRLIDFQSSASMWQAIMSDTTIGGTAENVSPEAGPTATSVYPDASGAAAYMGCTWTVRVIP